MVSNLSTGTAAISSNIWSVGALVANQSVALLVFGENYTDPAIQKSASFYANPGLTNGIALITSANAPIKFYTLSLLRLTVSSTVATFSIPIITTTVDHTGTGAAARFVPSVATTGLGNYIHWNRTSDGWTAAAIGQIYAGAGYGGVLVFATCGALNAAPIEALRISSTQQVGIGIIPTTLLHATLVDATTNAVVNAFTLGKNVTGAGVGADNIGVGMLWTLETSTTADTSAARIYAQAFAATHASRKFDLVATAFDTAEREGWRIHTDGVAGIFRTAAAREGAYATTAIGLTLTSVHHWVTVTAACTITLPACAGLTGREYIITALADNVIVDGNLAETISGDLTQTLATNDTIQIKTNGSNWFIV
jgi:hypothetical protein